VAALQALRSRRAELDRLAAQLDSEERNTLVGGEPDVKTGTRTLGQCPMTTRITALNDHRSVRRFAVKPRAFGAPYSALGLDRSARPSNRRPFHECTFVMLAGFEITWSSDSDR
jgi:hypothetical protein